jgi:hypothetical protein
MVSGLDYDLQFRYRSAYCVFIVLLPFTRSACLQNVSPHPMASRTNSSCDNLRTQRTVDKIVMFTIGTVCLVHITHIYSHHKFQKPGCKPGSGYLAFDGTADETHLNPVYVR